MSAPFLRYPVEGGPAVLTGAPVNERSNFYYRRRHKDYLQSYPDGRTVLVNCDSVVTALRLEGGGRKSADIEALLYAIRRDHAIDYDGPLPGYCRGLHRENGMELYCTSEPALPEPAPPETDPAPIFGSRWPVILELLRRLLVSEETGERQFWTFLASLKCSYESLKEALQSPKAGQKRSVRSGQALALVGPVNCGKTFVFEHVIAPVLGGRVVDAFKSFSAKADGFNSELLNGEVWKIDDRESSTESKVRRQFAANLKAYLYSGAVSFHAKGKTPITLKPFGRLFILCNDNPENLRVLPDLSDDIQGKIHILRCNPATPPMPASTDAERAAYRAAVSSEIPALLADLESWTIPVEYTEARTGVATYINPTVLRLLRQQEPEALMAELIQTAITVQLLDAERGRIWRGTASELQAILTGPSAPNRRQAEELLYWPKAAGTYLCRLADRSDLYATEYQLLVRKGPHQKGVQTYTITETDAPAEWRLPL
jgi:hypothetical protein